MIAWLTQAVTVGPFTAPAWVYWLMTFVGLDNLLRPRKR